MYSKLYSRFFYPFYENVVRGRQTFQRLREYENNQWRAIDELRQIQWAKLKQLILHVYENVPYYRAKFDQLHLSPEDFREPSDIRCLPFLTKSDVRQNQDRLLATNYGDSRLYASWTGGSTGEPVTFKYDRHSYECRIAASARADRWSGWDFGVRELYVWGLRPTSDSFAVRWKKQAHHKLLRRRMFNSYLFSSATLPAYVAEMNSFRPEIIVGYSGAIATLAQFIKERGVQCHSPKAVIATAEQVFPAQRALIENVFQSPVFNRYGSREFMIIGMECERHDGLHLNIDNQLIEVLKNGDPVKPGEIGEIVITDLNNYAMPFIRYKIGDLGVASDVVCPCGRGLPLLERVEGRIMDAIKTRDGRCVTGLFFTHLVKEYQGIRQFRVLQKSYQDIEIEIAREHSFDDACVGLMEHEIAKVMGESVRIVFRFVPDIAPLPSGKQRITCSDLPLTF